MMRHGIVILSALAFLTGCNTMTVREGVLSTNQRVAMVSSPGDGISPPTSVVLFEHRRGRYVPVATGFGQAPVPAFLTGAGAGIAVGLGAYAGRARNNVSNVFQGSASSQATGGSATGGTATGGSATSN